MNTFLVISCILAVAVAAKMPKAWKTCKKDDAACLTEAIENALHSMVGGMPSLTVLPLDPLHFNSIEIAQGRGPVQLKLTLKDVDIYGLKTSKIDYAKSEIDKGLLTFKMSTTDPIVLKGNYSTNGKIIILPIVGQGKCNLTFENFKADATLKGKISNKGKYFQVEKFDFHINTSRLRMWFGNLFNGDKAMGDNMNKFLNENWQVVLEELKPTISKTFGIAFKEIANRVFSRIAITEMFTS